MWFWWNRENLGHVPPKTSTSKPRPLNLYPYASKIETIFWNCLWVSGKIRDFKLDPKLLAFRFMPRESYLHLQIEWFTIDFTHFVKTQSLSAPHSQNTAPRPSGPCFRLDALLRAEKTRRAMLEAFTMGQHKRLGAAARILPLSPDVVQMIMDRVWGL